MKKNFVFFIVVVCFIILISFISAGKKANDKIDAKVYSALEKQNKVKVIVDLKEEVEERNLIFADVLKNVTNEDREEIIKNVGEEKVKHKFYSENSFSAELTEKEIENLIKNDEIKSIVYDSPVSAFLQDSAEIINATLAWNLQDSGINLTGSGQTICVVDTGINYLHPDLGGCFGQGCKVVGGWDYVNSDSNPMDDNGHGTHVAGISAGNNSIRGIAPDANLIAIKILDGSGSGSMSDLISGIEWCVNNASVYNISVITMSLGCNATSGGYKGFCDSVNDGCVSPTLVSAINNAVLHNISVVAATGNHGWNNAISCPACIQNTTAVGATNKDDSIYPNSDISNITDLLAPGANINSTYGSGYLIASGTSMAAPHVAGAIAILRQLLVLTNQVKSPKEIDSSLNFTGKMISDSGLFLSRINIYNASLYFDNIAPNVSLNSPGNNNVNLTINQTFSCNATDWQISNITFYLWNSTGLVNQTTFTVSGAFNQLNINITNLNYENYKWNCFGADARGNSAFALSNFTLTIGGIITLIISPEDNNYTNINETNFICQSDSETNSELINVTFYLWNSTDLVYNETKNISGFSNLSLFNYTFIHEDSYKWNCLSVNNNSNFSLNIENYSIIYDITNPSINLLPLFPASETSNSVLKTFYFNVSDNFNISKCSLVINNAVSLENSSITNLSSNYSFSKIFSPGDYNWKINCTDLAGNQNSSETKSFTITAPAVQASSSGGGGGGSGSSGTTYIANEEQIRGGFTKELKEQDKIRFTIFDAKSEEHTLTINDIGSNFVNLTLKSNPINIKLGISQSIKINLTSPDYYDLYIKLNSIENNKASLTIQTIHELIVINITDANEKENKTEKQPGEDLENEKKNYLIWFILISITVIAITAIIIHLIDKEVYKEKIKNTIKRYKKGKNEKSKTKP